MADQKLTELTVTTTPDNADLLYTVISPGSFPASRGITWTTVKAFMKTYFDGLYANSNSFTVVTTNTSMTVNTSYITNSATTLHMTLPVTAAVGTTIAITGLGSGGWILLQNSGQKIHLDGFDTTTGIQGSLISGSENDSVTLACVVANTEWNVTSITGNINIT